MALVQIRYMLKSVSEQNRSIVVSHANLNAVSRFYLWVTGFRKHMGSWKIGQGHIYFL